MNKFTLLLRKSAYPYEYMDDWEKFDFIKRRIYQEFEYGRCYRCRLHASKKNCEDFEIKNLREYHDLYLEGDTLLLADVFKNFRNICLKIYHLHPAKFHSAPGLA